MGKVVAYANNKFQCFCRLGLDNGEQIMISIAAMPTPSIKVMKIGFFGAWPIQTIWEYNPTIAGGYDTYVRKMVAMFHDPLSDPSKHPLDTLRDRLLPCRSIEEVRDSLFQAERNASDST